MIETFLIQNSIKFQSNVLLRTKTWIKRGGKAKYFIQPEILEQLSNIINFLNTNSIDYIIIGNTSNLYIKDSFEIEVVISIIRLNNYLFDKEKIICECGVNISSLSKKCVSLGYRGFEGLVDLPGTVGGAIINNSGCYNNTIKDLLLKIEVLNEKGEIYIIDPKDLEYTYRSSNIKRKENKLTILKVYLQITKADISELEKKALKYKNHRKKYQEGKKNNLGSIFSEIRYRDFEYNELSVKLLFFLLIYKTISKLVIKFRLPKGINNIIKRNFYLYFSGYYKILNKYISKKNINCFLWKDEDADKYFNDYIKMFEIIAEKKNLEIEIKE